MAGETDAGARGEEEQRLAGLGHLATLGNQDENDIQNAAAISTSAGHCSPMAELFNRNMSDGRIDSQLPFNMMDDNTTVAAAALPAQRIPSFSQIHVTQMPQIDPIRDHSYQQSHQTFSHAAFGGSEFGAINLDWLDLGGGEAFNLTNKDSSSNSDLQQMQCFQALPLDWTYADALPQTSDDNISASLAGDDNHPKTGHSAEQWPFDQARKSGRKRSRGSPLHDSPKNIPIQSSRSSRSEMLLRLMSGPYLPQIGDIQDAGVVSALAVLRASLDAFFVQFHPILPTIHVPSWRSESCPTVLIAAMACIGAMFCTDDPDAATHSKVFSDICIHSIASLVSLCL